ncbi:F-box/kelch-repeat protein At1g57790-like [Papaver somniferum]|uniref:F-box/kelch-repeat protein At1g57790-like n=1 Tax=Papaver somniferum TaxID=3469 RepID=UPI000E7023B9|nr:F-box/kelch-repeat protein At1g57790-like [Papaver somniferum]
MVRKDACKKNLANAVRGHEDCKHVGKDNAGDFAEMKACPWGNLNGDMVESIANSLHRLDYIHLRSVCKAYRALLPTAMFTSNTRGTHLSPWLMFSRDHNSTTFNSLNPMHNNENYLLNHSDLMRTVIRFQKGGWLLVSKEKMEHCLFFSNPFTRETIKLPELPVDFTFSSVSFSSLPTSPDCVVVSIELQSYDDDQVVCLYFIRKGGEFWSSRNFGGSDIENYMPSHNTPAFYKGRFYFEDYNGSLGVFNIKNNSWKVLEEPYQPFSDIYPSFLVECDGKLLLVKLGRHGTLLGIYRFERYCVKVKNLVKHMLFVSHISCFSAIAPNSHMANKVYFLRLCMNGEGVLFYCLETGSYRSFKSRHSASNFTDTEGWYSNCTWIEPNWSKSTAQELEWVNSTS